MPYMDSFQFISFMVLSGENLQSLSYISRLNEVFDERTAVRLCFKDVFAIYL